MDKKDSVVERIYMEGTWVARSPLHTGGDEPDAGGPDMALLRDEDGRFFIPAASIVGAARSFLARRADFDHEHPALRALFGGRDAHASALYASDATAENSPTPLVRDGVRLTPETGTAAHGARFDAEVLPRETRFPLKFEVRIFQEFLGTTPEEVRGVLRALLEALKGDIRLGARTRRGWGRGKVREWKIYRLNMANRADVAHWLAATWTSAEEQRPSSLEQAPQWAKPKLLRIRATLKLQSSILVRKAGMNPCDPDTVHLTEGGKAVVPGTSLAGAIRHRCLMIARTIWRDEPERASKVVQAMFGPVHQGDRVRRGKGLCAGKFNACDAVIETGQGAWYTQGRVAIDRFTGGALDQHLFDEAAFWPGPNGATIDVDFELERPAEDEARVLLFAFRDLWAGDLPIGGEIGIGRGVLCGVKGTVGYGENKVDCAGPEKWEEFLKEVQ